MKLLKLTIKSTLSGVTRLNSSQAFYESRLTGAIVSNQSSYFSRKNF